MPEGPTAELGVPHAVGNMIPSGAPSWSTFAENTDHVPELAWPNSIAVYERMRTDGQISALFRGTTLPIRQRIWSLDPNGAGDTLVEQLSEDLGLPVKGEEEKNVPRRPAGAFSFDDHIRESLLALMFGHYYFEQVGEVVDGLWRLRKLGARAPWTIADGGSFRVEKDGGLHSIQQGVGHGFGEGAVIPVNRLVGYVWDGDARTRWIGRSMLRDLYRHWLVKDRLIRVDAILHERAGGIPYIEAPVGATRAQIEELSRLAVEWKVGEHGGAAVPHGALLKLAAANPSAVIASINYHDEAMSRAWMLMLLQLGQTQSGARALGETFADFAALAVNAICDWFAATFTQHVIDDWVEWNFGAAVRYAPRLHHRERESDEGAPLSVEELALAVEKGIIRADDGIEAWLRSRRSLPPMESEREPVPPPVAAASRSRQARNDSRAVKAQTAPLPNRKLRRQPTEVEVRAAVDFAQMEAIFLTAMDEAVSLYEQRVIPAQIAEVRKAVTFTKTGKARSRVTQADMARITVPGLGYDELNEILLQASKAGAAEAARELAAQNVAIGEAQEAALAGRVSDQARAVTDLAAGGMQTAAQRKAVQLAGGTSAAADVADGVVEHLTSLKHAWTLDQIQGAVTMAQNVGRFETFSKLPASQPATFYASELLDGATCSACMAIDGKSYDKIGDAQLDYPSGGYSGCQGGPRCRGSVIVVAGSEQPAVT